MDHIGNRERLPIRTTATWTALAVAVAAVCAGATAARECAPSAVDTDIEGQPLTRAERIARLDEALEESLARFDECQNDTARAQEPGAESAGAGAADAGGDTAGTGDDTSAETAAAQGDGNAGTPPSAEPAATDGVDSVAATGVEGTEAPEDSETTTSGTERPPDSGGVSADIPDDIPEPDNDSVLEAQIRRAAMEETDPKIRAELWNEYRKYKGLPTRPLPDDDGEPSDARNSQ